MNIIIKLLKKKGWDIMKKQRICYLLMALLFICVTGCGAKQTLAQIDTSLSEDPNAFNHLASRNFDTDPSVFWFDKETGVSYYVNPSGDFYVYQLEGTKAKLVADIPAQELCMYDGLLYFMVENYDKRDLGDMHVGDIYCYNPAKDTLELVYPVGTMDKNGVRYELKVNENGLYFSYLVKDEEMSTKTSTAYMPYYYHLPFGATEPVKDELETTEIGWENYELFLTNPVSLVSRTEGMKDTIELSVNPFRCTIVGDMLYFVSLGDCNVHGLNLRTGEKIAYDFSNVIHKKDLVTGEIRISSSGMVVLDYFIITEKEIWVSNINELCHMDLETGELSYYKIEDDEKNRWSIYRLYIAGDELYAEVTPVYSSGEHKLVRLAVEDTRESNYTIEHYGKEFFMKIEDITK